jgi:dCTP deaminase
MILSDGEIWEAIQNKQLSFDPPLNPEQVAPSSIDLRLGNRFTIFPEPVEGFITTVDLRSDVDIEAGMNRYGKSITLNDDKAFTLKPGEFVLAYTLEKIQLSNALAARVEGRSSIGRLGISIHQTAPTVHATFTGHLRLEISHNGPFECKLYPGQRICQLIVERLGKPSMARLNSRFQEQTA